MIMGCQARTAGGDTGVGVRHGFVPSDEWRVRDRCLAVVRGPACASSAAVGGSRGWPVIAIRRAVSALTPYFIAVQR
jgi:hypothetical protein